MILGIDHVVILVDDLPTAMQNYSALGFTVLPGGEHTDGATRNALIIFADGTYFELLAFQREAPEHHWWRHTAAGEGLIDWALLPDSIAEDIAAVRDHGVSYAGPVAGGRQRPDGVEIKWQMGWPPTPVLPFFCADITPRSLRVPEGAVRDHPNGAFGIAGVTVAVADIAQRVRDYSALLPASLRNQINNVQAGDAALPPEFHMPEPGAQLALLPIGNNTILILAQPAAMTLDDPATQPLRRQLAQRGEGICALTLRAATSSSGRLAPDQTHGVPIDIVALE
jgi:catechol 2,3-dioxygenase-like lactoylglutathione lyase family enzyme